MIDYRIHVESTRNYTMPSSKDKAIPHNSKSVSYTHLDVYKRQSFSNVFVERVELFRSARKVIICLRSTEPLDSALCGRLLALSLIHI